MNCFSLSAICCTSSALQSVVTLYNKQENWYIKLLAKCCLINIRSQVLYKALKAGNQSAHAQRQKCPTTGARCFYIPSIAQKTKGFGDVGLGWYKMEKYRRLCYLSMSLYSFCVICSGKFIPCIWHTTGSCFAIVKCFLVFHGEMHVLILFTSIFSPLTYFMPFAIKLVFTY